MKTICYVALHYGASYLAYAIRSVIDYVDECYILYSPQGSHGTRISDPCPETREQLHAIAARAAGEKLRWIDGNWQAEGQHREAILQVCPDADVIVVLDSDEIYPEKTIQEIVGFFGQSRLVHAYRVPFVHFYRNFRRAIIHDPAYPVRVILPKNKTDKVETIPVFPIAHMGYCQPANIIQYKLSIHGHRAELRCGAREYTDTIYRDVNRWHDLHPVGSPYWDAEVVNPLDYLPAYMEQHPFWGLENVL